jgi:hypothetical protein
MFIFTYTFVLLSAATTDFYCATVFYRYRQYKTTAHNTPQQITLTPIIYAAKLTTDKTE